MLNPVFFSFDWVITYHIEIFVLVRGKTILEQLSRTRFLTDLKIPPFSSQERSTGEKGGNSKSRKKYVLESCSNMIFPLNSILLSTGKPKSITQ